MKLRPYPIIICQVCGKSFEVMPYRAVKAMYCSFGCRQKGISRKSSVARSNKQRARGNNKTYKKWFGRHLHRVVAEVKIGRPLLPGEIVHHIDGNKLNNSPENLQVTRQSEHIKTHFKSMMETRKAVAGY